MPQNAPKLQELVVCDISGARGDSGTTDGRIHERLFKSCETLCAGRQLTVPPLPRKVAHRGAENKRNKCKCTQ